MTDREKLEVIAHLGDHITYKEDIGIFYDSALAKVIEDAYMELKNGVTVQSGKDINVPNKWIPVKDRLPEEPLQTVLVTNGSSVCVGVYSVVYEEFGVMYGRGKDKRFGVTHWMPLPQPPKGE